MARFDNKFYEQWRQIRDARDNFVQRAATWDTRLQAGAPRDLIVDIGYSTSTLLERMLGSAAAVDELEPIARNDIGDATFDLSAWGAAAVTALQALTLQAKADYDLADGKLFDVNRAGNGLLSQGDIATTSGQTADLRAAIATAVAALA